MSKQLTIAFLLKNNQETIPALIASIKGKGVLLGGDIGSTDSTSEICKKNGVILKSVLSSSLSESKNKLLQFVDTPWVMFIEPWERLLSDMPKLNEMDKRSYSVQVIENGVINKPIRLWHTSRKLFFFNPIHEIIEDVNAEFLDIILYSGHGKLVEDEYKIITDWRREKPMSSTPIYYESFNHLSSGRYDDFLNCANSYFFMEKKGIAYIMMKYYVASVFLYVKQDQKKAMENLVPCLVANPLMAEFWCLLGDILYKSKQYERAIEIYTNAKIIGTRRLKSDPWPMHIDKYCDHPDKMIESCKSILAETMYVARR
jgi:hypothetical protein